jgi:hypothetical protein
MYKKKLEDAQPPIHAKREKRKNALQDKEID